jgi:hypothetical protein
MVGVSRADLAIRRVCNIGGSASVSNRSVEDAFIFLDGPVLEEDVLDAPEAAGGECGDLRRGNGGGHLASILGYVWFRTKGEEGEEARERSHGTHA